MTASLHGSHGLSARRARRTNSKRPKGPQRKLEVGARRAPKLLVFHNVEILCEDCADWVLSRALSGGNKYNRTPQEKETKKLLRPFSISAFYSVQVCFLLAASFCHLLPVVGHFHALPVHVGHESGETIVDPEIHNQP